MPDNSKFKSKGREKQTNKKKIIKTKNPKLPVRLSSLSCGMPVSEFFFSSMNAGKRKKKTNTI